MALAIHCDGLIRQGVVADRATLARVSRARVTQVLDLLYLAPDIQGAVLDLRYDGGRAPLLLADLRPVAKDMHWGRQRRLWAALRKSM